MRSGLAGRAEKIRGSRKTQAAGMVLTKSATHGGSISTTQIPVAPKAETLHHRVLRNVCNRRSPSQAKHGTAIELPIAL